MAKKAQTCPHCDVTHREPKTKKSVWSIRLTKSVEDLNTSLPQSAGELWCCKLGQKIGWGGTKRVNYFLSINLNSSLAPIGKLLPYVYLLNWACVRLIKQLMLTRYFLPIANTITDEFWHQSVLQYCETVFFNHRPKKI